MIYADNAATTRLNPEVLESMIPYLTDYYGNPSSPYSFGEKSRCAIEEARCICAGAIGCMPSEIYFTSGGSEANNLVIKSYNNVLTSSIEHHSILNTEITKPLVKVDIYGEVIKKSLENQLKTGKYDLVSIMFANNEIGTIQCINSLADLSHRYGVPFHTDAVQAFGHFNINVNTYKMDYMSVSGHKFGAPKGTGFLFAKNGSKLVPLINGGQQESGVRGGTENVAGIVGLGKAVQIVEREMNKRALYIRDLSDALKSELYGKLGDKAIINGYLPRKIDGTTNVTIKGIDASALIEYLNENDIYVSSGSACDTSNQAPSHVLLAIGLSPEDAESTIRISLNQDNTFEDIHIITNKIKEFTQMIGE